MPKQDIVKKLKECRDNMWVDPMEEGIDRKILVILLNTLVEETKELGDLVEGLGYLNRVWSKYAAT